MKKIAVIVTLSLLTACNDAAPDEARIIDEPISLNEVAKPVTELPVKKEMTNSQTHDIAITVPDGTWSLSVQDVLETETETAIVVALSQAEGMMGIQVISELVTAVEFASEKPAKVYVIGKTWNWENSEGYEFVDAGFEFEGRPIEFKIVEPSRKSGPKTQMLDTS